MGGLKSVCIYGGVPKPQQKADLRAGAEVSSKEKSKKRRREEKRSSKRKVGEK